MVGWLLKSGVGGVVRKKGGKGGLLKRGVRVGSYKSLMFGGLVLLIFLIIVSMLTGFGLSQKPYLSSYVILDEKYLEGLRLNAGVECLQNSQCSEGYICFKNKCKENGEINFCEEISLSGVNHKLQVGGSINYVKKAISNYRLPNLLADGKLVEIVDDELIEHFYKPTILIGNSEIKKETKTYFIKPESNETIYPFRFIFSKSVDFSSKNIQGQVLRILGKEYVIGGNSTNSIIYLISDDKEIKLENGEGVGVGGISIGGTLVELSRDSKGDVAMFKILFNMQNNLKVEDNYVDPVFDGIKLSFKHVDKNKK